MVKTMWLHKGLHKELKILLKRIRGSLRPEAALTAMLEWRALTGYRGRSSGCAQTCAMACICGSLYSCRASPSRDALCSRLVRVVTVRKLSSCCGRLHPRFLQPCASQCLGSQHASVAEPAETEENPRLAGVCNSSNTSTFQGYSGRQWVLRYETSTGLGSCHVTEALTLRTEPGSRRGPHRHGSWCTAWLPGA